MLFSPVVAPSNVKPIYVLHGTDAFLCDTYRRQIIATVVGEADPQLCVTQFDPTAELPEVLDELRTPSFLTATRIVVVRDADAFVSAYREQLERYLAAPAPDASLMLIVSSFPKTTRIYKLVAKIGEVRDCSAGGDLVRWVRQAAIKRDKKIDPEAAELLTQWIGDDLGALDGQIEKLSLYAADRDQITIDDIAAIVTAAAGPAAFAVTNAIAAGDAPEALRALGATLRQRGDEFRVLGSIGWHLRRALATKQDIASGREVKLRIPYQQREVFLSYVKDRPLAKFQADFRRLIRADLALKTGTDAPGALQPLLVNLCS